MQSLLKFLWVSNAYFLFFPKIQVVGRIYLFICFQILSLVRNLELGGAIQQFREHRISLAYFFYFESYERPVKILYSILLIGILLRLLIVPFSSFKNLNTRVFFLYNLWQYQTHTATEPSTHCSWQPPPFGYIKINCGGAFELASNKAALGSITTDDKSFVMWVKNCYHSSVFYANVVKALTL